MIYCSLLEAGQPHSVLTWHEVPLCHFQTSLKELSTLPSIFSFIKLSERGFARVGHAKENKSLLGIGGGGPSALEVITGCSVPAADSAVGNFRGFFSLPRSGLAHQRNVGREKTENGIHVLLKQMKWRALLASACPRGLELEEQPTLSTLGPPAASALPMWPRPRFSVPLHGGSQGRAKRDAVQSLVPRPCSALVWGE